MTCKQVLDLIDAAPFIDTTPERLQAARQHARECERCDAAWKVADTLTTDLLQLHQPAASPELTASIVAQIARIEPVDPVPVRARDRSTGITAVAGLSIGMFGVLLTVAGGVASPNLRLTLNGVAASPSTASAVLVLASALLIYAVGLFAPVGHRGQRRRASHQDS